MLNRYWFWIVIVGIAGIVLVSVMTNWPKQQPSVEDSQDISSTIISNIQQSGTDCGDGGCRVDKVFGDYAKGVMPMAYWIAQKTDNKWKVVVGGNGIPNCSKIEEFNIPKEIYTNCIETSGSLRFE